MTRNDLNTYLHITLGAALCALGINLFIVPVNLYNGGAIGIAQIIRTLLNLNVSFDIAGIINLMINIPLFILAYKGVSRKFFVRTVYSLLVQTILFSFIVLDAPIIEDRLAACLIGGIITAHGVGMTLRYGSSCGGIDILGVYYTSKKPDASVGQLSGIINGIIYAICAVLFDLPTAIYSIIYACIFSLVVDKAHHQNINVSVMIFSKVDYLQDLIMFDLKRGVTCWKGIGGYTDSSTNILYTVISKYEINQLKKCILEVDPKAFIIVTEGLNVTGNLEKRL